MKKIVITGGHLTPALAVIDELDREKWQIVFVGRLHAGGDKVTPSVEAQIIPQMGIKFIPITTGQVYREISLRAIKSLFKIPLGLVQACLILAREQPDIVLSFGGYLSVPVVMAGWLGRIPIVTHEQTTVKGLANKFNARLADKICVSWPETVKNFPSNKVILTGNPIRKAIFETDKRFWQSLKFTPGKPLILVTGGNQGSHIINQNIGQILRTVLPKYNLFHQCGHLQVNHDCRKLEQIKKGLPEAYRSSYQVRTYIDGRQMGTLYRQASLVIARAGINTISELIGWGKPAILIPYPHLYQNEQLKNARMMAKLGLAEVIEEKNFTPRSLSALITKMLNNIGHYQRRAKTVGKLIKQNAAQKMVAILEELVQSPN